MLSLQDTLQVSLCAGTGSLSRHSARPSHCSPARLQLSGLVLSPSPHVMPRGRLQLLQSPRHQAASLQLPARRGQGRTCKV